MPASYALYCSVVRIVLNTRSDSAGAQASIVGLAHRLREAGVDATLSDRDDYERYDVADLPRLRPRARGGSARQPAYPGRTLRPEAVAAGVDRRGARGRLPARQLGRAARGVPAPQPQRARALHVPHRARPRAAHAVRERARGRLPRQPRSPRGDGGHGRAGGARGARPAAAAWSSWRSTTSRRADARCCGMPDEPPSSTSATCSSRRRGARHDRVADDPRRAGGASTSASSRTCSRCSGAGARSAATASLEPCARLRALRPPAAVQGVLEPGPAVSVRTSRRARRRRPDARRLAQFVLDGVSGFLAASPHGWLEALERLADDPALRTSTAAELRARLDAAYDRQVRDLLAFLEQPDARPAGRASRGSGRPRTTSASCRSTPRPSPAAAARAPSCAPAAAAATLMLVYINFALRGRRLRRRQRLPAHARRRARAARRRTITDATRRAFDVALLNALTDGLDARRRAPARRSRHAARAPQDGLPWVAARSGLRAGRRRRRARRRAPGRVRPLSRAHDLPEPLQPRRVRRRRSPGRSSVIVERRRRAGLQLPRAGDRRPRRGEPLRGRRLELVERREQGLPRVPPHRRAARRSRRPARHARRARAGGRRAPNDPRASRARPAARSPTTLRRRHVILQLAQVGDVLERAARRAELRPPGRVPRLGRERRGRGRVRRRVRRRPVRRARRAAAALRRDRRRACPTTRTAIRPVADRYLDGARGGRVGSRARREPRLTRRLRSQTSRHSPLERARERLVGELGRARAAPPPRTPRAARRPPRAARSRRR